MARSIIIDTDPGIDDAVAILLALAAMEFDVLGLIAVAGNLPLAATSRNARAIVELAGRGDIAVYAGCPRPIGGSGSGAADAHGDGGLGDLALPAPVDRGTPASRQFQAEPRADARVFCGACG
jgi:purine nucleosidase